MLIERNHQRSMLRVQIKMVLVFLQVTMLCLIIFLLDLELYLEYIERIKIEPGGYGRALYIDHPNGTTSVYAHLSRLNDTLNNFIKNEQYKNQSFYVDIYLKPNQFPVHQCEVIAYSGNAGMSSGPHLHFEIRDTKTQNTLNGLLPDFQIQDTINPTFKALWVYPR